MYEDLVMFSIHKLVDILSFYANLQIQFCYVWAIVCSLANQIRLAPDQIPPCRFKRLIGDESICGMLVVADNIRYTKKLPSNW